MQRPQLDRWECPYPVRGESDLGDSSGGNLSSTFSDVSGLELLRGPVGLDARFQPSAPRCRSARDFGGGSDGPDPIILYRCHNTSVEVCITVEKARIAAAGHIPRFGPVAVQPNVRWDFGSR